MDDVGTAAVAKPTAPTIVPRILNWLAVLVLVAVIALGVTLRFSNLGHAQLWANECATLLIISGFQATDVEALISNHIVTFGDILSYYQGIAGHRSLADTINVLIVTITPHTPAYYALAYYWAHWAGTQEGALRMLSAILGLLQLPAVFWFAWELFGSKRIALFCTALLCISPIQVWYSQEAAEYSWIAATTCIANAIFLRALRTQSTLWWIGYFLVMAIGLYVSLNIGWIGIAHLIAIFIYERPEIEGDSATLSKNFILFASAGFLAVITFLPFVYTLYQGLTWGLASAMKFMSIREPLTVLTSAWLDTINACVIWTGDSQSFSSLKLPVCLLALYALIFCWRRCEGLPRNLLLLNVFIPFVALALPDVVFGGTRSTYARYMMTAIVSLTIAIGYCLSRQIGSKIWCLPGLIATALIWTLQLLCCRAVIMADTHFVSPYRQEQAKIVDVLRNDRGSLVISGKADNMTIYGIFSLCHLVPKETRLLWLDHANTLQFPPDVNHFYLYKPTFLEKSLVRTYGYQLTPVLSDWSFVKAVPNEKF